jgi:hypothetical protein
MRRRGPLFPKCVFVFAAVTGGIQPHRGLMKLCSSHRERKVALVHFHKE